MKIGLIGTGRMGTALGGRLLDGGHSLRVFDLDPMSVAPLVARGATHAAALEDTFDTDLVITLVDQLCDGRPAGGRPRRCWAPVPVGAAVRPPAAGGAR